MNAIGQLDQMQTAIRRLRVASLVLRGLTTDEVALALPKNGVVDPRTQLPYAPDVIAGDIAYLEAVWEQEAQLPGREHRARVLAELREVKRSAWAKGDLAVVVRCLREEAALCTLSDVTPDEDLQLTRL